MTIPKGELSFIGSKLEKPLQQMQGFLYALIFCVLWLLRLFKGGLLCAVSHIVARFFFLYSVHIERFSVAFSSESGIIWACRERVLKQTHSGDTAQL